MTYVSPFTGPSGPVRSCIVYRHEDRRERVDTAGHACYILTEEKRNMVPRGSIILVPLLDGVPEDIPAVLPGGTMIGYATIPRHAITAPSNVPGYEAASDRAAAYRVDAPAGTMGVILVRLRLPHLENQKCISCRTLHFFYTLR